MNCGRVERLLSRHMEGRLPARAAGAVAAHLDGCPACRRRRAELLAVGAELRTLAALPAPPEVERRAIACWEAERRAPGAGRGALFAGGLAATGIVLITLLGLAAARRGLPRRQTPAAGFLALRQPELPPPVRRARPPVNGGPVGLGSRLKAARRSVGGAQAQAIRPGAGSVIGTPAGRTAEVAARTAQGLPSRMESRGGTGRPGVDGAMVAINARHGGSTWESEPESAMRRWGWPPVEEQESIEARVRGAVRARDDFIQIPFPRLVSTAEQQIAQAVESYKREAAVVDDRLARAVTLREKATALSDLCDRLRGDTGIQLSAGSSVADEKVTLFCEKMPLRDVMRQLSRPFGYTWLRSRRGSLRSADGAGQEEAARASRGEYRYELVQDLRSQLLEEELRNRDRNAALLAVDQEMSRYRQYLSLSPDEALARSRTASPAEKKLLERFAGSGWGVAQLYFRLTPRDLAALRAGQRLAFSAAPRPEEQPLPPELARGVLQSLRDTRVVWRDGQAQVRAASAAPEGIPPASAPEARATVSLWMGETELGQFMLDGDSGVRLDTRRDGYATGSPLAFGVSPAVRNPQNAVANARLVGDPALRARVTVLPQPSCGVDLSPQPPPRNGEGELAPSPGSSGLKAPWKAASRMANKHPSPLRGGAGGEVNSVTSADVLEAVHRASGLPIVADYYTRLFVSQTVSVKSEPLFEALNHLADAMRLRWNKDGGWLQFRSASYFNDRLKEVPNRMLSRWAALRTEHGALTLDDLIEIAQLSDAQLDGQEMADGARSCFGLAEWDLARHRSPRPHLRFLAGFSPAQRRAVASATGLPFTQMSLVQQEKFVSLALGTQADRLPSLRALEHAAMRVDYVLPGRFEWKAPVKPDGPFWSTLVPPLVREQSPEAALRAARRIDPQAEPSHLIPTELALTIMYPLGGPETGFRNPFILRVCPGKGWIASVRAHPIDP